MKKLIPCIILAVILVPFSLFGQGSWLDATNVVGNGNVTITDMEIDSNGDAYIIGWFDTNIISNVGSITTNGNFDIFLLKINSDGSHAWLKGFGGNFPDLPGGVELGPDNSVYISGAVNGTVFFDATTSITTTAADAFLAKFDFDGTLSWVKIVAGGPKAQRSEAMALDGDKIILSGFAVDSVIYDSQRVGYAGKFTHISTYDLDGNHLLYNTIGFKDVGLPYSIAPTTDGYAISGYFRDSLFLDIDSLSNMSTGFDSDIYLYKTDKNLNGMWIRRTTSMFGENVAYSVRYDGVDELYLVGKTGALDLLIDSTDSEKVQVIRTTGSDEFFIFNYQNSSGTLDWYTIDGSNRVDGLWDVLILPDRLVSTGYYTGDYYFGNDTLFNNAPNSKEIFVTEHDLNGNIIYARDAFSDPLKSSDQGYRLGVTQEGEILISGVYRSEVINFEDTQFSNISPGEADIFLGTFGCLGGGIVSTTSSDLKCYDNYSGEISVAAEGGHTNPHYGYAYDALFDNGDSVISRKFFSPATLTGFPIGTYDITVYDNANCMIGTSSAVIDQPDSLIYSYEVIQPGCGGDTAGTIIISSVSGGVAPYQFSINCGADFQNDTIFAGLAAGDYCIIVEDANGCQTLAIDTTLTSVDPIIFEFEILNDTLKCFGDTDGEIDFKNVTGGSGEYMFSIDGGATYQIDTFFIGLTGGDYHLVVTDTSNCTSAIIDTSIFSPDAVMFTYTVSDTLCFGETGNIVFNTTDGGSGNYQYSIDGGMTYLPDTAFMNVEEGEYQLTVLDDSLCSSDTIIEQMIVPELFEIVSFTSESNPDGEGGTLEVEVTGGTEPYIYTLKPTDITQVGNGTFTLTEDGVYWISIDDANSCGPIITDTYRFGPSAIREYNLIDALVYPNPTSGQITVKMKYDKPSCLIEVWSLTGQVVSSQKAYTDGYEIYEVIDLSHLANGMYMLKIDGMALKSGIVVN